MRVKLVKRFILIFNIIILTLFVSLSIFLYSKIGRESIILILIMALMIFLMLLKGYIIKVIFELNSGLSFKEVLDKLNFKNIKLFK